MEKGWWQLDRMTGHFNTVLKKCEMIYNIEVKSIILFGARARGDRSSQSNYEFLILIEDTVNLYNYVNFTNALSIELLKEKMNCVKFLTYTAEIFEETLYKDTTMGTFFYMICRENIVLYDKGSTFTAIKERLVKYNIKDEEAFLSQCVEFVRSMGSVKWERKWEKLLLQQRYQKMRKGF